MSWNYRIVRFRDKTARNGYYYKVCEVYYDGDNPVNYCDAKIGGETLKECFADVMPLMMDGMRKAYIKEEDFEIEQPSGISGQLKRACKCKWGV